MKKNVLQRIKDKLPEMSKAQKLLSNYILENYEKAAYMTACKLADTVGVSESTVVRFAFELEYDGYPELLQALRDVVRTRLTSFQRVEVINNIIGEGDVLTKVLMTDANKIKRTLDDIDRAAFDSAIRNIISARNIYIMGVRSCSFLAGFLNHSLRMLFDNIKFVQTTSGSEMFEQIMSIGQGDVMVAISFPRYSKRIINAVDFAKNSGAHVIALTDSNLSPIAANADDLLLAESDMASYMDTLVAPLSIINAMIVALSLEKQAELSERLH